MDNDIVNQLVRGSEEIDRMRKEIKLLVSMVARLLSESFGEDVFYQMFAIPNCVWKFERVRKKGPIAIWCIRVELGAVQSGIYHALSNDLANEWIYLSHVQEVHNNLNFLMEGVVAKFPAIEKWQPLLDAANAVRK